MFCHSCAISLMDVIKLSHLIGTIKQVNDQRHQNQMTLNTLKLTAQCMPFNYNMDKLLYTVTYPNTWLISFSNIILQKDIFVLVGNISVTTFKQINTSGEGKQFFILAPTVHVILKTINPLMHLSIFSWLSLHDSWQKEPTFPQLPTFTQSDW